MNQKDCINKNIEEALKNKDINNIMNRACRKFSKQLDQDELYTCKLNALWKSFVNFKPEKQCKFTTYLFRGVYIECLKAVKFINKSNKAHKINMDIPCTKNTDLLMMELLDEVDTEFEKCLIKDKMAKMTNQELSEKYNIGKETIRKKIKKITKNFQHKF